MKYRVSPSSTSSKDMTNYYIGGGIAAAFIVIGLVLYFFVFKKKSEEEEQENYTSCKKMADCPTVQSRGRNPLKWTRKCGGGIGGLTSKQCYHCSGANSQSCVNV